MVKQGRQEWPAMRGGQSGVLSESSGAGACKRRGTLQLRRRRWPPSGQAALGLVFQGNKWAGEQLLPTCKRVDALLVLSHVPASRREGGRVGSASVFIALQSRHCPVQTHSATGPAPAFSTIRRGGSREAA